MIEQYIGGQNGGIPEYVFDRHFGKKTITGASGEQLTCFLQERTIEIAPLYNDDDTLFYGYVDRQGHLGLNIKTRKPRHPDLYAGKLVRRFLQYAEENEYPVTGINGSWSSPGDNYRTFMNHLNGIAKERSTTDHDEINAANKTWTGLLAHDLGFTHTTVSDNGRESNVVRSHFRREDTIFEI